MKRFWSTAAALLLALVGLAGLAAPASAQDGCTPGTGYVPQGVCSVTVETTPYCTATGVPRVEYVVTTQGATSPTVTITWVNPTGTDVVQTGLPLRGDVAWPSGSWASGAVEVNFNVGPSAVLTLNRPTGGTCDAVSASRVLSATGSDAMPLVVGSAAFVGLGLVVLLVARRRRAATQA